MHGLESGDDEGHYKKETKDADRNPKDSIDPAVITHPALGFV